MKNNEIRYLKTMLPMNIQFFAEPDGGDTGNGAEASPDGAEETGLKRVVTLPNSLEQR